LCRLLLSPRCSDYDTHSTILTVMCLWIHKLCVSPCQEPAATTGNNLLPASGVGLKPAVLMGKTYEQEAERRTTYIGFALVHLRGACRALHLLDLPTILHLISLNKVIATSSTLIWKSSSTA
jgi:hypothetical protein